MEIPSTKGGGPQPPEQFLHYYNPNNEEHPEHVRSSISPNNTRTGIAAAVSPPDQQQSYSTTQYAMMMAPPAAIHSSNNTTITSSVVNGIGQWKSWCRSFATPLLAMLDLVDNALDAAVGGGGNNDDDAGSSSSNNNNYYRPQNSSRIVINYDKPYSAHHYNQSNNETTGLVMTNNSVEPIKSMHEILRVYNSRKTNDNGQHIGQNGVGLKQGCATLSPCSFCLVKKTTTTATATTQEGAQITTTTTNCYSLGILAGSLQTEQMCFLPVLQHDDDYFLSGTSAERQMALLSWAEQNRGIAKCVQDYGSGSLLLGVQRLDKHMTQMAKGKWKQYDHVFRLVLFGMHHQTNISSSSSEEEEEQQQEEEDLQHDRVKGLLDQLIEDLPRRYLHVPDHVSVIICHQRIRFGYWQSRMADMARFDLKIKKTIPIANDPNWDTFSSQQKDCNYGVDNETDCYSIRIFVGFDFVRLTQEDSSNDLAMYVYSRRPGRLIQTTPSARHKLALTSGSSEYNQAMTILIDDYKGKLPLNPTKQDLAFSEEANGEIHRQNLDAWTRFAAKVFYRYYKDSKFGKSKELITEALKWVAKNKVQQQQAQEDNSGNAAFSFPQLHECQFNQFKGVLVKSTIRNGKIQLAPLNRQELVVGEHSQIFKMPNKGSLLEDHRIAQLVARKRKREKESPTLITEKDGEISYLTGRIDELEAQLQEAKSTSETEQTEAMADKIDELEEAFQDYKTREKEWEAEKSLLKTDCEAMKKEIKHLKFTIKEKDQNLERFRNYYYGDSKRDDV